MKVMFTNHILKSVNQIYKKGEEHMDNLEIKNKVALYNNGMKVTEHIYDKGTKYDTVTILQRGNTIDVFNNKTKKQVFYLNNVERYRVIGKYIYIYNKSKFKNINYIRVYTLSGDLVISEVLGDVQEKNNYFRIEYFLSGKTAVYKYNKKELSEIIPQDDYYSIILGEKYIIGSKEVKDEILYGIYSYSGKEIIPIEYNKINIYYNIFLVKKFDNNDKEKYGAYTKNGRQLLKPEYDRYHLFTYLNCYVFYIGDKCCLCNIEKCKIILPLKFKEIKSFGYDCIYATEDGEKYSIYSYEGKKLLDDLYDSVRKYDDHVLELKKGDRTYYYLTQYHSNNIIDADVYDIRVIGGVSSIQIKEKNETHWRTLLWSSL